MIKSNKKAYFFNNLIKCLNLLHLKIFLFKIIKKFLSKYLLFENGLVFYPIKSVYLFFLYLTI